MLTWKPSLPSAGLPLRRGVVSCPGESAGHGRCTLRVSRGGGGTGNFWSFRDKSAPANSLSQSDEFADLFGPSKTAAVGFLCGCEVNWRKWASEKKSTKEKWNWVSEESLWLHCGKQTEVCRRRSFTSARFRSFFSLSGFKKDQSKSILGPTHGTHINP